MPPTNLALVPNMPFMPPLEPYILPSRAFDMLIDNYGVRLLWQKSHLCACLYAGPIPGSPDQQCQTCSGRGWYWDAPYGPFTGLITFIHMSPTPDEPGAINSEKFGFIQRSEPTLTLPHTLGPNDTSLPYADVLSDYDVLSDPDIFNLKGTSGSVNQAWIYAALNDVFVEPDTLTRFETELQVGGNTTLPYQYNIAIAPSGAVTVYDPVVHRTVAVSGYVVSGSTVTLPSSFAEGTAYIVSYEASKAYVAWRIAGSEPHSRPFASSSQPRRFRLQELDLWLRSSGRI